MKKGEHSPDLSPAPRVAASSCCGRRLNRVRGRGDRKRENRVRRKGGKEKKEERSHSRRGKMREGRRKRETMQREELCATCRTRSQEGAQR